MSWSSNKFFCFNQQQKHIFLTQFLSVIFILGIIESQIVTAGKDLSGHLVQSSYFSDEETETEKLSNLLKITQLFSDRFRSASSWAGLLSTVLPHLCCCHYEVDRGKYYLPSFIDRKTENLLARVSCPISGRTDPLTFHEGYQLLSESVRTNLSSFSFSPLGQGAFIALKNKQKQLYYAF